MDLPARLPKTYLRLSTLDLSQGGRFARVRENVVKSGHVLNPSEESGLIGYVDNSRAVSGLKVAVLLTARGLSVFLSSNAPLLLGQIK